MSHVPYVPGAVCAVRCPYVPYVPRTVRTVRCPYVPYVPLLCRGHMDISLYKQHSGETGDIQTRHLIVRTALLGSIRAIILLGQQGHWGSRSARAGDGLRQGEDKGRES